MNLYLFWRHFKVKMFQKWFNFVFYLFALFNNWKVRTSGLIVYSKSKIVGILFETQPHDSCLLINFGILEIL